MIARRKTEFLLDAARKMGVQCGAVNPGCGAGVGYLRPVDRLGRSLQDPNRRLAEPKEKNVDLYREQQSHDTATPACRALLQMLRASAEFERATIKVRIKAGSARGSTHWERLRRPMVDRDVECAAQAARADGKSLRKIAAEIGMGVGTVQRIVSTI